MEATMATMRGGRQRQWWSVDFADAELADNAGDNAAAAVAWDLARGAAIPARGGVGGGGGGGGGGSDGTCGWLW